MKKTTCYLCGGREYSRIHKGVRNNPKIDVWKCNQCGLVWLSEFMDANEDFYENSGMREGRTSDLREIRITAEEDDRRRFEFVKGAIRNKRVLDFGCGAGGFLRFTKDVAKVVEGIELEKSMRDVLEKEGFRCYASIHDAKDNLREQVDVITMFHVLEHLEDPIGMLMELKKFLKPSGRMIIEVPNADDALLSLYQSDAFADFTYWDCHLYLFTNATLRNTVEKAGLKVKAMQQIQRYPLANHLYWLAKRAPGGHEKWFSLMDETLDQAYGAKLSALGMADTIMVEVEL